jgi:hypothetical protein
MKRKPKAKPDKVADLPTNPEFQQFADFTRELLNIPKMEIDRRVEEDRIRRQKAKSD